MTALAIVAATVTAGAQEACTMAATNAGASIQTPSPKPAAEKIEEYQNPGAPIKVDASRKFSISIAANPTTGYGWQLAKPIDEKIAVLITNSYVQQETDIPRVGAGGHEIWTFKAVDAGQTEISLKYIRPWEKDVAPAKTNVFTVIVK
jgi:inhibitor of cysteine peptidase